MWEKTPKRNWLILFVIILASLLSFGVAAYINQANHIASTPQKTWRLFLVALENADVQQVQRLTTSRWFGYMVERTDGEILHELPYLAKHWANSEVRWRMDDESTMEAWVATDSGEFVFIFVKESNEWKIDTWVAPDT